MEELPALPSELIRKEIFPRLPACDVFRLRAMGKAWKQAYLQSTADGVNPAQHINATQPSRGGSIPVRFLISSEELQDEATMDMRPRRIMPRLINHFPAARSPLVVASHQGFLCIRLCDPCQLFIWNPVIPGEQIEVPTLPYPASRHLSSRTIGLHVSVNDGLGTSKRCTLVATYLNPDVPEHQSNAERLGVLVWQSGEDWLPPATDSFVGIYEPKAVVTLEDKIYFQVSSTHIFIFNVPEYMLQPSDMAPAIRFSLRFMPSRIYDALLVIWRGSLAAVYLDRDDGQIHFVRANRQFMGWLHSHTVDMIPIVDQFRPEFVSCRYNLRKRESPTAVLSNTVIMGYSNDFIFLYHRDGVLRISLEDNRVKRIEWARTEAVLSLSSSFLRLPIAQ